ncbi:hypothetical protein, partial [Paenibacillus lactis]|uniref:hypothetical protein n=1 Tax=Paenibacillus lactis TaxID=228574 RepID=UPI003676C443
NFIVRLASLGAVWQQGVIPQEQTTRLTGGSDNRSGRMRCKAPIDLIFIVSRKDGTYNAARV